MNEFQILVGEHVLKVSCNSDNLVDFFTRNFIHNKSHDILPKMTVDIQDGFGTSFRDYEVEIVKKSGKIFFHRADYLITTDYEYKNATVQVHDELALKHALMNLYSSFIVHHNWGLLIHSSCVIENGKAHIFSGHSGAGKSTAAKLSQPRELLSDEATIVRITPHEAIIFNSPFRSEMEATGFEKSAPLESIQILHQAHQNKRLKLKKADSLLELMDKVFFWVHSPDETKQIIGLLKKLVDSVPVYELHFKKDHTFWELIS